MEGIDDDNNNNNNGPPEHHQEQQEANHVADTSWSEVVVNGGTAPSARSLHSGAVLNGVFYIFGGYDGTQRTNSFHAFSFTEHRWSPVLQNANSAPPPSPRDRHVSVAFGNSIYIHGGFDGTSRDAALYCFDLSVMAWSQVITTGRPPSARHSHAAIVWDQKMLVFGGYDGSYKSDLHELDFRTGRWSAVPAAGRRPRARYRATCVNYQNFMILYGGHDGTRHLNDTFLFDCLSKTWHTLITVGPPPLARDSHIAVVHQDSMYIFGGSSGSALNDLHECQLPANVDSVGKWRPIATNTSVRQRFCHVAGTYGDCLYAFGGYDGQERLSSFICFDFGVYDLSFDIPEPTILSDLSHLVNNERLSDVTFLVERKTIYAHKLLLMRCSYFEALFMGNMREASLDTITIEQVRYDVFLCVLEYLYTDQLEVRLDNAMELFQAADLFCIHRLKIMCEKRMLQSINIENAAEIFHAADLYSADTLRAKTKKYILSHWEAVSKTTAFEEMGRTNIELVFEFLQSR